MTPVHNLICHYYQHIVPNPYKCTHMVNMRIKRYAYADGPVLFSRLFLECSKCVTVADTLSWYYLKLGYQCLLPSSLARYQRYLHAQPFHESWYQVFLPAKCDIMIFTLIIWTVISSNMLVSMLKIRFEKAWLVLLCVFISVSLAFMNASRKHAYIILTPLNPTFI